MRCLVFALALLGATAVAARAQDAVPDLKGVWSGKGKSIVFGNNPHHPGSQTPADQPRVRDIEATYTIEGQEGRLVWGHSSSKAADTKEPLAWAISRDRMEKCYTHNGLGPSRSVVAACHLMDRVKRRICSHRRFF